MTQDERDRKESFWERFSRLWDQSNAEEEKITLWEATQYSHTPYANRTWRWLEFRQKDDDEDG